MPQRIRTQGLRDRYDRQMRIAVTRPVPRSISRCELTHLARTPIDVERARAQHEEYEATLRRLGCVVERIDAADDLPDSVFVEDAAVVLDEIAVITRPGAASRQPETESVERALARYRPIRSLGAPATMDGGDVLRIGRRLYVGISGRTSEEGARQLAAAVRPFGYTVEGLRVTGCLHLKSAATAIDDRTIVCNPDWVDARAFDGCEVIAVHREEPFAANVLRVGGALVCAVEYPRTAAALRARGSDVHLVEASELAKAEAGVTCCSVLLDV